MDAATRNQIRLFVLVVLAFLPAVGLYWYASGAAREAAEAQREQELVQFVSSAAVEYQTLVEESRGLLGALQEFPEIRQGGAACSRRLAAVLQHLPQYTTLSHIGLDGYATCGSLTMDGDLYLGDRAYFRLAMATNRFAVGDYAIGRITGKPTVGFAYPIEDEPGAGVESVLAISLDLTRLGTAASLLSIPDGATFTVLDRSGTVMIRVPEGVTAEGGDTVGARLPKESLALPQGVRAPYVDTGVDLDGVTRRFAIAPLKGGQSRPGGFLMVGVEEESIAEASEAVAGQEVRFLALAGLAVLGLAWLFGHYSLVRPMQVAEV